MSGLIFILQIPILINIIGRIMPELKNEEVIGDSASGLSSCSYSIGDFGGPFLGGMICAAVQF